MTTKLTLSLDKKTVEKAKKVAARKKTSVSKLVSNYFEKIPENNTRKKDPKDLKALIGALKTGKSFTDKDIDDARWEYLKKKHGL